MGLATLFRIQFTQIWNRLRNFKEESKLKILVILFFAIALWLGLYYMFWESFVYLKNSYYEFEVQLIESIFSLFFFSLFIMLTFSNGIIIFSSLFRSEETRDLLTRPISPEAIFLSTFSSAILFSSWAFLFLAAPLMAAFGISHSLPLQFYPIAMVFFVIFLFLPAALGALMALLITYYFPRSKRAIFVVILIALVGFGAYKYKDVSDLREKDAPFTEKWMDQVFEKISFAKHPAYPSFWMSEGILASSSGDYNRGTFLFLFLLSNSLFFSMGSFWVASRLFRKTYNLVASHGNSKRNETLKFWDRLCSPFLFFLRPAMRQMILKDAKTFFRDPVQWSQLFIFLGLLTLYILNIRRLEYNKALGAWKVMITYLNMFAVSLTLSTFTSRFIFPQISLEGKRMWILGVFPITRRNLLTGKFLFSFGGTLILSEIIMVLSCWMIEAPLNMTLLNMMLMVLICMGLSGLSVGLGALYPNFAEENPSKIVSGFGGTLNLIISLLFVVSLVTLQGFPVFFYYGRGMDLRDFYFWIAVSTGISLVITLLVAFVPMTLGKRLFEKMEL